MVIRLILSDQVTFIVQDTIPISGCGSRTEVHKLSDNKMHTHPNKCTCVTVHLFHQSWYTV